MKETKRIVRDRRKMKGKRVIAGILLAGILAGCGKSEAERHRLSKKAKARLDSLDRAALKIALP